MGFQRYLGVSIFLLIVTEYVATTAAAAGNVKTVGAGPCPLPEKAATLGNLTAILAARLNGSETVGSTGDSGASGRICLAIFQLNGDYNVFYHALVATSKPGAPTTAYIARGWAGKAGTAFIIKIAGPKVKWDNKTLLRQPTYKYAKQGMWLKASTLPSSIKHVSIKKLLDAMRSAASGYYGAFTTESFTAGAARGQFNNDPLPPSPGGKEGLVLVGVVGANLTDRNVNPRVPGDMYGIGCVSIAAFLNTTTNDYVIRYHVSMNTSDSEGPNEVLVLQGLDVPLTLVNGSATWTNRTSPDANVVGKYMYEITGTIPGTYKPLMNGMLAAPQAYSAVPFTSYFDMGALRGWFVNTTLAGGNGCAIV